MKCTIDRRNFLKIPVITTGIMIGSMAIPPLVKIAKPAQREMGPSIEGFVRVGVRKFTIPIPAFIINKVVRSGLQRSKQKAQRFSKDKRELHHFVVRELPNRGQPLRLEFIANELGMPLEKVALLADELEQDKTFLYRKDSDGINWAYPVTVDDTPHRVIFSTGEQINAA